MKLSEFKAHLAQLSEIIFILPSGSFVPKHFHVTEVGSVDKTFIDCGGTLRKEQKINFQLWEAADFDHRLAPKKLREIIELAEKQLRLNDTEIEVEYQTETIGKYELDFDGSSFLLVNTLTDCLAKEKCGIPEEKEKLKLINLGANQCAPGSGCC